MSGTILIRNHTTVTFNGDRAASSITVDSTTSSTDSDSANTAEGNSSSSSEDKFFTLRTSRLGLPSGLSSEVVGVVPPNQSTLDDTGALSGPLFYVNGGNIIMQDVIVRDGYAVNADNSDESKGAGIYAAHTKRNTIRCEFINYFAGSRGAGSTGRIRQSSWSSPSLQSAGLDSSSCPGMRTKKAKAWAFR